MEILSGLTFGTITSLENFLVRHLLQWRAVQVAETAKGAAQLRHTSLAQAGCCKVLVEGCAPGLWVRQPGFASTEARYRVSRQLFDWVYLLLAV